MKKCWMLLAAPLLVGTLIWPRVSTSGPIEGTIRRPNPNQDKIRIPGGSPGEQEMTVRFAGGQRACVILVGDPRHEGANVGIEIKDEDNRVVARDDGKGDYATVVWYPPRDGDYKLVLQNKFARSNDCYLVIK